MNVGLGKAPAKASSIRRFAEHITSPSQKENTNTPKRLKQRATLVLEPGARDGKGWAHIVPRSQSRADGARTNKPKQWRLPAESLCASRFSHRATPTIYSHTNVRNLDADYLTKPGCNYPKHPKRLNHTTRALVFQRQDSRAHIV